MCCRGRYIAALLDGAAARKAFVAQYAAEVICFVGGMVDGLLAASQTLQLDSNQLSGSLPDFWGGIGCQQMRRVPCVHLS